MRMQAIRRAPELSATSRMVPIWIMRLRSRDAGRGTRNANRSPSWASSPESRVPSPESCCPSCLRLHENLSQDPALPLREGASLFDADAVADFRRVALVMRHEAAGPLNGSLVARLLDPALHLDHDRLVHPVRHDPADLRLPGAVDLLG